MFDWRGRKIAITGATGFVGHHLAMEMRRAGADVVALVRPTSATRRLTDANIACAVAPLDDEASMVRHLSGREVVIHAAGAVGFDDAHDAYREVNVHGTRRLLAAARRTSVRRVIHTSSIVAVGASSSRRSLDESAPWNLGVHRVPYITTKREAETLALAANDGGLEVVVVNPGSVIGPDDHSRSEFGSLCRRFWKGRIPFCFGGGNNFVDVRDVARGIRLAAESGTPGQRYLLTGANRGYEEFFREMSRVAGRSIPLVRLPNVAADLFGFLGGILPRHSSKRPYLSAKQAGLLGLYFHYDSGKAMRELGFHARPLTETLRDSHAFWMASSPAKAA